MLANAIRRAVGVESPVGRTDPLSNFWYQPIGGTSSSGVTVTDDVALSISTLYACVRILSDSLGILPVHIYEQLDEDRKQRATEHPWELTLTARPNAWMTPFEWKNLGVVHLCLRGNYYSRIVKPGIDSDYWQFVPLHPDRVTIKQQSTGHLRYTHEPLEGPSRTYDDSQILHIRLMSSDGVKGCSPIQYARDTIGLSKSRQSMLGGLYKGGGFIKYFLKTTKHLNPEGRKNFRESWRDVHATRPGEPYSPPILEDDMDLKTLGMSNEDLQVIEAERISAIEICQFFGVPPHLVFLLDRATFSNIEHQGIEYKSLHLQPWAVRFEQAIESHFDPTDPFYVEFLMDALLRGDTQSRYEAYSKALGGRAFMTINEARRKEGWEPIEGEDEIPPPPNASLPGDGGSEAEDEQEAVDDGDDDEQVQADPSPVQLDAPRIDWSPLALDAATRIVERELIGLKARSAKANDDRMLFNAWVSEWYARHQSIVLEIVTPLFKTAGVQLPDQLASSYCDLQSATVAKAADVPVLLSQWRVNKAGIIANQLETLICTSTS